jgi:hypothetical protein
MKQAVQVTEKSGSGLDVTGFFQSEWAKKHEPERGPDLQLVGIASPAFLSTVIPIVLADQLLPRKDQRARSTILGRVWRNSVPLVRMLLKISVSASEWCQFGFVSIANR